MNDWHKNIAEIAAAYMTPKELYKNFYDDLIPERDIISTGIREIDDCIVGIFPSSLVVVAGETGEGKSLLAGNVAMNAIAQNRKVVYFDLENDSGDFFLRQLSRELIVKGVYLRHSDLRIKERYEKHEDIIAATSMELTEKLNGRFLLYSNEKIPTISDFERYLSLVEVTTNLVVIDHLHYFDFEKEQTDTENLGKIMRQLRTITRQKKIPIILVSHVRKRQNRTGAIGNDDLFGSSNIAKEAETVIMLSKDIAGPKIAVTKNRNAGILKSWNYEKKGYGVVNLREEKLDGKLESIYS